MFSEKWNSDDPFSSLSPILKELLIKSGWTPGCSRRNKTRKKRSYLIKRIFQENQIFNQGKSNLNPAFQKAHWKEFEGARRILDELNGLTIPPIERLGPLIPTSVTFGNCILNHYIPKLSKLESILNVKVTPVADTDGHSELMYANSGHLLLFGWSCPGVFILGNSFGEGLLRHLTGLEVRPIFFSEIHDPTREFQLQGLTIEDPLAVVPSNSTGLIGIDTRMEIEV